LLIAEDIVEDIEGGGRGCGGHTATLVHSPDTGRRGRDGPAAPAARLTRSAQRRGRPQLPGCATAGGWELQARALEAAESERWSQSDTLRRRHCPNATTSRRPQP